MTNGVSENLYVGLYLPGQRQPVTAALLKFERNGQRESGNFAYGLGYLERPGVLTQQNLLNLPTRKHRRSGVFSHLTGAGRAIPPCRR